MQINRRAFLRVASTSPLVFGLGELFAQESPRQEAPSWWKGALSRMKELGRPGLVFIAPAEAGAREALAKAILDLLESEDSRAREIFCSAVVACFRPDVARACFADDAAPGRVLVLDPAGRVVGKYDLRLDELRDPLAFEGHFSKRLYGEGDARLSGPAELLRAKLTDEEKSAFAELTAEDLAARERASGALTKRSETLMPLLVLERRSSKDPERAARIRRIIDARFGAADEKTPGPRLPFGTWIEPGYGGCSAQEDGVAVQCGMGRLEGKGQRFLRFLEK